MVEILAGVGTSLVKEIKLAIYWINLSDPSDLFVVTSKNLRTGVEQATTFVVICNVYFHYYRSGFNVN